jgi:homoserine O-acetyltransferase/O-succinyltransferase
MGHSHIHFRKCAWTIVVPLLLIASHAFGGAPAPKPDAGGDEPEHQVASLGSFRFESGEVIDDLKVSYVTYGKLSQARDNVILSLQHFAGDHRDNEFLIGPGKALDPDKNFIIATDFLGNARLRQDLTTGPTNSGLKARFPRITARDWVNADYKLVKEYLGIDHVKAAIGASIGGINAYQIAVSHPEFVSSIVVMAAGPRTNPQSKLVLRHVRNVIALDPGWYGGMYDVNPITGLDIALMGLVPWFRSTQWYVETLTSPQKVRDYEKFWHNIWTVAAPSDARDIYYQLDGWAEFDVGDTPGFSGDTKAALAKIKAKALLIAIKEDLLFLRDEMLSASHAMHDATYFEISSAAGHIAVVGGVDPKADEAMNREIAEFLSTVK